MQPFIHAGNPFGVDPALAEKLRANRTPHGPLIQCSCYSYQCPNTPIAQWNSDTHSYIGAARTGAEITLTTDVKQGDTVITTYRAATDVLKEIEAFAEKENLAALSQLPPALMPTGGQLTQNLKLTFAPPEPAGKPEERLLDYYALQQWGLASLYDTVYGLLQDAVKGATRLSREEKHHITPEAEALLKQPQAPRGRLLSCTYRHNLFFSEADKSKDGTRRITIQRDGANETVTVRDEGPFRHTNTTVYQTTGLLSQLEAFAKQENLAALSALQPQRGGTMGFSGMTIGFRGPGEAQNLNDIMLTFLPPPTGGDVTLTRLNMKLMAQHGLGYLTKAFEAIISDAIKSAVVLSQTEEVNELVRTVETLRQNHQPHGALKSCSIGSGDPNGDSFYLYTAARTESGLTLTKLEKAQYRNKITTVFRPATDFLAELEAFAEKENLAAFAALRCQNVGIYPGMFSPNRTQPHNDITLVYAPAVPGGPEETFRISLPALREYGLSDLASPFHKQLTEGGNGGTVLDCRWVCQICGKTDITERVCPACGTRMDAVITPQQRQQMPHPQPAPAQPKQPTPAQATGESWICGNCGASNNGGKFCITCGDIRPQARKQPTAPAPEGGWICSCGETVTGKFCPNCGSARP